MGRAFLTADERAKKDDDLRAPGKGSGLPLFRSRLAPAAAVHRSRMVLKRLALVLGLAFLVYLFVHNLPTDVPVRPTRRPLYMPISEQGRQGQGHGASGQMPNLGTPGRKPDRGPTSGDGDGVPPLAAYNGPVKFERLAESLEAIHGGTGPSASNNRNVLFAAASLRSAALLLPLACRMGGERRNNVHFALLGGSGAAMDDLRAVNGINEGCEIAFHDGRPDMATKSSTKRLRQSTIRAIYHINEHMHPQALIVDASGSEEDYFLAGARQQTSVSGITLIELPENAHSRLGWITKLDSSSLAAWGKVNVEILIPAFSAVPGSLVHLLKSLSAADFSAGPTPHLTIELPHHVDRPTADFLKTFQWPPGRPSASSSPSQLTLRHRIPRARLTEEESSVRFLESFWPAVDPGYSHVLVLSPQVQVSTQFFHYVKYSILYYLYSDTTTTQMWDTRLLGISLDLPTTLLDDTASFSPPSAAKTKTTPFLWQAPNSNALLFTGAKWAELHALVSESIAYHERNQGALPKLFTDKLVAKTRPAWLEHALRLARARGYVALYPSTGSLVTVHTELYRAPEEYPGAGAGAGYNSELIAPATRNMLLESLALPSFEEMPLLAWDGRETAVEGLDKEAAAYTEEFRRAVGGCEKLREEEIKPRASMRDLFCLGEDD
ncbi:hypothetical protein VTJ49DRAFT_6138 [Mycothermus thermophilus]|uniref:Glycosyltransferase 2 n=1 Tax=Humicola insolens TaxID=85995 RepID=A0ABR3VK59_HUMIN